MRNEVVSLPKIKLNWSDWYSVDALKEDERKSKIKIPNHSGVYEVRDEFENILHIGRASNLRHRIRQALVKGKSKHSTRERMLKDKVDFKKLKIRWAKTEYPNAVEEYLHKKHKKIFGVLPKYSKVT
jgi:excinuclease UvrABC nuclease subunit